MDIVARLREIVGTANVLTGEDMAPHCVDWRGRYRGAARCVVRPGSTDETAAVVRVCAEARVPVVPQGGNTSLCGGATPDDAGTAVVVAMGRMNRVRAIDTENGTLTAEAGCPLAAVQAAAARYKRRIRYHLKIDTGMNRLGFRSDNLKRTLPGLLASQNLELEGLYTHFATADVPEHPLFDEQRVRFARAIDDVAALGGKPRYRHACNSAALLRDSRVWYDLVRPGLLLYGIVPPPLASTVPLAPVMTLSSRVVAVKGMRTGEITGYGGRFTAEEPTTIAIVPAGYADGLDLRLAGRGAVLIRGRRAPIVGSVCMDMLMVNVTGMEVSPGDEVVIIGAQGEDRIDAREMAAAVGTIPWEVVCRVGSRIERVYG